MVFVSLQPGGLDKGLRQKTGMPHKTSPDVAAATVLPPLPQVYPVFNDSKPACSFQNLTRSLPFYQLF